MKQVLSQQQLLRRRMRMQLEAETLNMKLTEFCLNSIRMQPEAERRAG